MYFRSVYFWWGYFRWVNNQLFQYSIQLLDHVVLFHSITNFNWTWARFYYRKSLSSGILAFFYMTCCYDVCQWRAISDSVTVTRHCMTSRRKKGTRCFDFQGIGNGQYTRLTVPPKHNYQYTVFHTCIPSQPMNQIAQSDPTGLIYISLSAD